MPVAASDIHFRLSGGAANTSPSASLGAKMSNTEVVLSPIMNNLFDDVTALEASAGSVEYRCIYVSNRHATDALTSGKVWINANTPSTDTTIAIGLDPAGVGNGDTSGEATSVVNETTAPSGVTFSSPSTEGASLTIGAIAALNGFALWVRRTVNPSSAPVSNDPFSLTFKGIPA